jgi:hypothetical protein
MKQTIETEPILVKIKTYKAEEVIAYGGADAFAKNKASVSSVIVNADFIFEPISDNDLAAGLAYLENTKHF